MKNKYVVMANRWWLAVVCLMSVSLSALAQTSQPPMVQWQRIINFDSMFLQHVQVVKASNGGYAVVSGTQLIRLSADGDVTWRTEVTGVYLKGSKRYAIVGILSSLVATPDGGFAVLVGDEYFNSIAKFDAAGNLTWQNVLVDRLIGGRIEMNTDYVALIATPDGGYLVAGNVAPGNTRYVVVNKLDGAGNKVWESTVSYGDANFPPATFVSKIINSPDGGYLLVGSTKIGGLAAKFNSEGKVIAKEAYDYLSTIRDVIPAPNGSEGYIVVGANKNGTGTSTLRINPTSGPEHIGATSSPNAVLSARAIVDDGAGHYTVLSQAAQNAGDFQLTNYTLQNETRWTKTLGGSGTDVPQGLVATDDDGYVVVGTTTSTDGDVRGKTTNSPAGWIVKLAPVAPTNALTISQPTYNCQTGAITFVTSGGDSSPITYNAPGISRSSATDNKGTVEPGLRNDPKSIAITATQSGRTVSYTFDFKAFCTGSQPPAPPVDPPTPPAPPTGSTLALTQPTYNCSTGAITFNTSGGDGSPITYSAPGISRASATSNTGTVESGLRSDPKPITIMAMQNGQSATYTFDFGAFCTGTLPPPVTPPTPPTPPAPPTGSALVLLAPSYDCATGAIVFRTSGGTGSGTPAAPIEYAAAGITGWTTNPNQFVDKDSRTAGDVQPFTLMARQNGVMVTYVWDLKAACGRARVGTAEAEAGLSIAVLGNPVSDAVTMEIRGAAGQPLTLRLVDRRGRLLEQRVIGQAMETEHQRFDLSQSGPGLLLLRAGSGNQSQTVKILRQ